MDRKDHEKRLRIFPNMRWYEWLCIFIATWLACCWFEFQDYKGIHSQIKLQRKAIRYLYQQYNHSAGDPDPVLELEIKQMLEGK